MVPSCGAVSPAAERPTDLKGFICISDAKSLERSIADGTPKILISQGRYLIDNPIVIDRGGLLFLFGAGRLRTKLVARNPNRPLFVVQQIERFAALGLEMISHEESGDIPLIEVLNQRPLILEVQDSFMRHGGLHLRGPVRAIVQGSHFQGDRKAQSRGSINGIVVDHPEAELYMVAGNMSGRSGSHILQRSGHVEIYGTGLQGHGTSDIVLSSPSQKDAHIIAAVRSEGTNTLDASTFLLVPETHAPVNVVLKANNFSSPRQASNAVPVCELPVAPNIFADYHANGQIWLLGNYCHSNVRTLVRSTSQTSKIFAIGNAIKGCLDKTDPAGNIFSKHSASELVDVYNVYDHAAVTQETENPRRRFVSPSHRLGNYANAPAIPENANGGTIPRIGRPRIPQAPPKEFLRSVHDYATHSACKGSKDDTCYIQKAIDEEGARLYFPAGTYKVSRPIQLNQTSSQIGGMIAGAGSAATHIVSSCGGAFASDGMAYVTIQGISFTASNSGGAVVGLEWPENVNGRQNQFVATQANNFYDVSFEGGKYGLGIGRLSPRQCSENLVVDSSFTGSYIGLSVGHYNALANTLHGVRFTDTDWNVGFSDEGIGGTWAVFEADANGTKRGIIHRYSIGRNLYHNRFRSDGPELLRIGWNSNESIAFFEHSEFTPSTPTKPFLDFSAGQGVIILRSLVSKGDMRLGGNSAASFIISLESKLAGQVSIVPKQACTGKSPEMIERKICFTIYEEWGTK